jgi:uncharacterized protein (DUF488 family)
MKLLTFGHGTASAEELADLIRNAEIEAVVDVRSVPKSRRHPQFWREQMQEWVPQLAGCTYRWNPQLGGFRSARRDSANIALRHPAFRGYADYMETPAFHEALETLLHEAEAERTAIMCSESLWWRCHRRLISDAAVLLHGVDVQHLFHSEKLSAHVPTPGVRVLDPQHLRYDVTTNDDGS